MRIVCISDTHGDHAKVNLPDGDVLIHAGDITAHGTKEGLIDFAAWFGKQAHSHKIFIAGNHDTFLEQEPDTVTGIATDNGISYLCDSGIVINGLLLWGSPITPRFFDWSFMRDAGDDIERHWKMIPDETNVLITHGPVWGILDEVERSDTVTENTGCPSLAETVKRIQPDYHVFGHIHEAYGREQSDNTLHLNVCTMNKSYQIHNDPVVLDLE